MKVTGYTLREALKAQELRRDTAANAFPGSLKKFEGESKESPLVIMNEFLDAEDAIAKLQVVQARYNLNVLVTAGGVSMPLAEAVKRLGGMSRAEKMWRTATGSAPDRYGYHNDERNKDVMVAQSTITSSNAVKFAKGASKNTGFFRAAIATGNAVEFEADIDPKLFD